MYTFSRSKISAHLDTRWAHTLWPVCLPLHHENTIIFFFVQRYFCWVTTQNKCVCVCARLLLIFFFSLSVSEIQMKIFVIQLVFWYYITVFFSVLRTLLQVTGKITIIQDQIQLEIRFFTQWPNKSRSYLSLQCTQAYIPQWCFIAEICK